MDPAFFFFMICFFIVAFGPATGRLVLDILWSPFGAMFILFALALLFASIVNEMLAD
jgi:hypothetical protein